MSKIGKKFISLPEGVQITLPGESVQVKGPKGELSVPLHRAIRIETKDQKVFVSVAKPDDRRQKALWGTFRSLVANAILGVTQGFEKKLEIVGVGYKAAVDGSKLILSLGFSHPVEIAIPKGLEVRLEKSIISISGMSKQEVGEFASLVRSKREPEPYKGKGIKYVDELVRRKAGKVVKAVGAG